ncbi:MAG: hypothetical protein KAY96_04345, partial [Bacteroidia bacterium]|nr:hypothetical protein [Bacteroidia bacterium]
MKKIQSPFLQIAILALMLLGQGQLVSAQKQQIALEDIWLNGKFRPDFPSEFNWMKDDNFYTELDGTKIEKFGIKDQSKVATILDIATLKNPADGS